MMLSALRSRWIILSRCIAYVKRIIYGDSTNYLFEDFDCFSFRDPSSLIDFLCKSTSIAILNHHYFEPFVFISCITFHHVFIVHLEHHLRFCFCQPPSDIFDSGATLISFDGCEVDDFDCNLFPSLPVHSPVDGPECPTV